MIMMKGKQHMLWNTTIIEYLQVNALGEWIIGIYLHEFTNNEQEISIPHEVAECAIENFQVHCWWTSAGKLW